MTIEERKALQTILIDEVCNRQESDPTLLIDAILTNQGPLFIAQLLTGRANQARQALQINEHLLRLLAPQTQAQQPAYVGPGNGLMPHPADSLAGAEE